MNILVVTQYFWPENFRINDLVSELVKRGHKLTILTGMPNYPEGYLFKSYRQSPESYSVYQGAEVFRVPMICRGESKFRLVLNYISFAVSASLIGAWKLRGRNFDSIFTYEPSPITVGLPAVLLRYIKKAPLILWVLDLWPESLEATGVVRSRVVLHIVRRLVSFIYSKCDIILAQSKSFIPQIRKYSTTGTPIEYFPGWAEDSVLSMGDFCYDQLKKEDGIFDILFAGNIGEAQDFPAILAAAEILKGNPAVRWLIVGSGRKSPWVEEQIKSRKLEECVFLLGRYPLEAMPLFFGFADALLVSLKNEPIFEFTIPAKLQSYLTAARPIIGMLNGEGAKVILDSGSGMVCSSGNSFALANCVLELLNMTVEQRLQMGKRGLIFSNTEFNKKDLIDRLEVLLVKY